eukprot:scaffold85331_cov72-Phaeocystis_antarctica.AAC.1
MPPTKVRLLPHSHAPEQPAPVAHVCILHPVPARRRIDRVRAGATRSDFTRRWPTAAFVAQPHLHAPTAAPARNVPPASLCMRTAGHRPRWGEINLYRRCPSASSVAEACRRQEVRRQEAGQEVLGQEARGQEDHRQEAGGGQEEVGGQEARGGQEVGGQEAREEGPGQEGCRQEVPGQEGHQEEVGPQEEGLGQEVDEL